jgi:hypothetical protein
MTCREVRLAVLSQVRLLLLALTACANPGRRTTTTPESSWDTALGQTWSVESADLDGDTRPDLVAPDTTANALWIWLSSSR